jgi:hypothetical protein
MSQYTYTYICNWNIWQYRPLTYSHILFAYKKHVHQRWLINQAKISVKNNK